MNQTRLEPSSAPGSIGAEYPIAQWAAQNPRIRRVWVCESATLPAQTQINIALELEPVGDSEETLAVWIGNAARWRSQLGSRVSASFQLQWFDPDGSTLAAMQKDNVLVYERAS